MKLNLKFVFCRIIFTISDGIIDFSDAGKRKSFVPFNVNDDS